MCETPCLQGRRKYITSQENTFITQGKWDVLLQVKEKYLEKKAQTTVKSMKRSFPKDWRRDTINKKVKDLRKEQFGRK